MNEKPTLHVVSFSGGKDSTAMLLRMIEEKMPIDIILYCDTGLEFPEMEEHIDKVEKYIGRKITRLKSDKDFMYYAAEHERTVRSKKIPGVKPGDITYGYGYPSPFSRWCTSKLKTDIIANYLRNLYEKYEVIEYVGIAYDEPHRERDRVYPLITWKMTEADCLKYCYSHGFNWGGLYEIWDRVSCWCCPLQSLDDLRKLKTYRPLLWDKLREMDKTISKTLRPNIQHYKSLTDIERRFEVEDEFIAQGKKLRTKEFFNELKRRGIKY
jgi:3'-phosphoadenosine 5'-phosphosulfate sulfotransferase (PAPS reductase)/FAD synthetase